MYIYLILIAYTDNTDIQIFSFFKWNGKLEVFPILEKNDPLHDIRLTWNGLHDNFMLVQYI